MQDTASAHLPSVAEAKEDPDDGGSFSAKQKRKSKKGGAIDEPPKPPSRTMIMNGKVYVLIDDRWYPKADDDVYLIKGEKIYFVDNGRTEDYSALLHGAVEPAKVMNAKGNPDDLMRSVSANPFAVQSPTNIKKMFDTLDKAKARMKERDEALEALSTAED